MSAKVHPVIDIPSSDDEEEPSVIVLSHPTLLITNETKPLPSGPLPLSFDQPHLSSSVKCSLWCSTYRSSILCIGTSLVITIILLVVLLRASHSTTESTSTNPCEGYKMDDFASSISLACFRFMWLNAGCKSTVPDGYAGWYLRSPDGGKTVLCLPPKTGSLCGAGSYGAILNSIWRCDLEFKGY